MKGFFSREQRAKSKEQRAESKEQRARAKRAKTKSSGKEQNLKNYIMKTNPLLDKSFRFAIEIVELFKVLQKEKKEFILSKQILKSGTSIGANAEEAVGGISKKDYIAKLSIAYKEARETKYWLKLLKATGYLEDKSFNDLFQKCEELCKILYSSITTAKRRNNS